MADTGLKMDNLSDWKENLLTKHVQAQTVVSGDFLSSETVVMIAGPAELVNETDLNTAVPVGLVQNVQVAQQKNLQQIFEVGSRKPYFVPGRTMISAGISRILFDGPSLMYAMYLSKAAKGASAATRVGYAVPSTLDPLADSPAAPWADTSGSAVTEGIGINNTGEMFINLASGFFNKPLGLGFVFYDTNQVPYGGFYMENCYVQSHQINIASQQTILVENISLRVSSLKPLDVTSIPGASATPTTPTT